MNGIHKSQMIENNNNIQISKKINLQKVKLKKVQFHNNKSVEIFRHRK